MLAIKENNWVDNVETSVVGILLWMLDMHICSSSAIIILMGYMVARVNNIYIEENILLPYTSVETRSVK